MDRKSFLILLVSFGLLMAWYPLVNKLFPPLPAPEGTNAVTQAPRDIDTNKSGASQPVPATPSPAPPVTPLDTSKIIRPEVAEETVTVTNENARYTFTTHGGGLKLIELIKYPATISCDRKQTTNRNRLATLNDRAGRPAMAFVGGEALEGDGLFKLTVMPFGLRAEKALSNGLHVIKDFALSTNYLVKATNRIENRSSQPVPLPPHECIVGTATPMGNRDESMMMGVQWYNGKKAEDAVASSAGCFSGRPQTEYMGGSSNVFWAAAFNQFFAIVGVPAQPAARLRAHKVNFPPPSKEELDADSKTWAQPFGYQVSFVYSGTTLAPNQSLEHSFDLYAGPKEYYALSLLGRNLDLVMRFGVFGFFAKGLLLSLKGLFAITHNYGAAIIVITILIKLFFWPLTNASTKSMKRMAALQPQMKALQEKYKDDPRKMNMKLMEFMKENRVSPLGGCLPMVLQIPVFIGFYQMLQSAIELRGAGFLWACDLSQPDTVFVIPGLGFIPFFGIPGSGLPINPLPLMMGVTMLWQARLTPPSPGMDPVQQSIMKYMPLMFMVFLYNFSAGLTLYWTVQNLLTILQMKVTKATDPKKQPAARPASPTVLAPKKKRQP
ncbi:MAG: membrane protein insertase YidC [Verrucomicrobia bacterium]|nr:membrane protein insertase YidC [Verrucomicrobiota bacterium]